MREKWDMYRLYMNTRAYTERSGRSSSNRIDRSRLNRAAVPANRHRPWTLLKTLKYLPLPAYVYVYIHMCTIMAIISNMKVMQTETYVCCKLYFPLASTSFARIWAGHESKLCQSSWLELGLGDGFGE